MQIKELHSVEGLKPDNETHVPLNRLKRVCREFLEYCKDRYSSETLRHYTMNVDRFLCYSSRLKVRHVEELSRDFITGYVSFVNHDEINKTTDLALGQPEKESRLYPVKSFLRYCQRKGYLKNDLTRFIYVPAREKKALKRALTIEEMQRLLEVPDINTDVGIRNRALFEMAYSGLRADELLSLKLEYVDVVTNSVSIINGKGNKDRVVPMTSEALYWVKRWLNRRPNFLKGVTDPSYLFITQGAKTINRRNFLALIKKSAKRAGMELDISPHDLRRATATHLVLNGAPIRQIQALLGHATLRVMATYLRLTDENIKAEHKKSHPSNRRDLHYGTIQK